MLNDPTIQQHVKTYDETQTRLFILHLNQFYDDINELRTANSASTNISQTDKASLENQLYQNFMTKVDELFDNGANINAKGKDEISLLYILGILSSDVNSQMKMANYLKKYKLDVNLDINGVPILSHLFRRGCYKPCLLLIKHGFDLDISLSHKGKIASTAGIFQDIFARNTEERLVSSKKGRPYNFNEALYPRNTTDLSWKLPNTDASIVEQGLIERDIENFSTFEEHFERFNSNGLKSFYVNKLNQLNLNRMRSHYAALIPFLEDDFKDENLDLNHFNVILTLEKLEDLKIRKDENTLNQEEEAIYAFYQKNKIQIDSFHDIERIGQQIFDDLENINGDKNEVIQSVNVILERINECFKTNISIEELNQFPIDFYGSAQSWKYYRLSDDQEKLLNAQKTITCHARKVVMLSHKLGVMGEIDLENEDYKIDKLNLEGFTVVNTLPEVASSLNDYSQSNAYRELKANYSEEEENATNKALELIMDAYERAIKVYDDSKNVNNWNETALAYRQGKPVIFESRWKGHSAMTVLYRDHIYICNKGAGTDRASIQGYKIADPSSLLGNNAAMKFMQLATTTRNDKRILGELSGILPGGPTFSSPAMMDEFQLTRVSLQSVKGQKIGNCSYTNTKRGIDGILMALQDRQKMNAVDYQYPDGCPENWSAIDIDATLVDRDALYGSFAFHDRIREVSSYFELLDQIGELKTTHRSYLSPLLLALRDQNDATSRKNVQLGRMILDELRKREFSDLEIYQMLEDLPSLATIGKLNKLVRRFGESWNGELDLITRYRSWHQLWLDLLPGGSRYRSNEFLREIDMSGNVLKESYWERMVTFYLGERAVEIPLEDETNRVLFPDEAQKSGEREPIAESELKGELELKDELELKEEKSEEWVVPHRRSKAVRLSKSRQIEDIGEHIKGQSSQSYDHKKPTSTPGKK